MGLIRQKIELKCLDTLGNKSQIMEYYSYRKLIPLMTLSLTGVTILKVNCFFTWNHKSMGRHDWIFR